jgi:hypothetical protein
MGWHIGMTEEEMKEFAGMSCQVSKEKEIVTNSKPDESNTTTTPYKEIGKTAATSLASSFNKKGSTACPLPRSSLPPPPPPDVQFIYHLCQKAKWDEAVNAKLPYFPPTYMKDGKFTRASIYKEDIVSVANMYYVETPGKWIVLEIDCPMLYSLGIPILVQVAPGSILETPVKCLQIFGGISTSFPLVRRVYPVFRNRSNGEFLKLLEPFSTTMSCTRPQHKSGKGGTSNSKVGNSQEQFRTKKGFIERLKRGFT